MHNYFIDVIIYSLATVDKARVQKTLFLVTALSRLSILPKIG
ncbi:hypothetical protein [Rodentibacter ratti]|nr:hypothetical protein [Rodentibacter ratti]